MCVLAFGRREAQGKGAGNQGPLLRVLEGRDAGDLRGLAAFFPLMERAFAVRSNACMAARRSFLGSDAMLLAIICTICSVA